MEFWEIFKEDNGRLSTLRFLVVIIVLTILFNWTYICFVTGTYINISWQEIVLIISPLAAKVTQKKFERNKDC